jgi:hypothetical protein
MSIEGRTHHGGGNAHVQFEKNGKVKMPDNNFGSCSFKN